MTDLNPDLTVIVSYEEGAPIVTELVRGGVDPATMIGLESFLQPNIATTSAPDGDVDLVDGFTVLGATGDRAFFQRLIEDDPNGQVANAAQAYDCADRARPRQRGRRRRVVRLDERRRPRASPPAARTCTTYDDCLTKLNAGEDIDYDGASGRIAIDENGDPTFGRFTTASLEGGEFANIKTSDVDIAEIRREQAAFAAAAFTTKLQQALTFLGFYTGPIDGLDSPELTAALAAFQASVGLPPTGIYDAATDAALRAALGAYSDLLNTSTTELQILMTELGYYSGPIDGVWNTDLTAAVRAFQRDLGVPETGVLDAATIRRHTRPASRRARPDDHRRAPATTAAPETTAAPTTAAPPTAAPTTAAPTTVPPTAPPTTIPPPPEPRRTSTTRSWPTGTSRCSSSSLLASGFDNDVQRPGDVHRVRSDDEAFDADPTELARLRCADSGRADRLPRLLHRGWRRSSRRPRCRIGTPDDLRRSARRSPATPPDLLVDGVADLDCTTA